MLTLNHIWFPGGYTDHDYLLPDADKVFEAIIGRSFESLRDIRRAYVKAAASYGKYFCAGIGNQWRSVSELNAKAEIVNAAL